MSSVITALVAKVQMDTSEVSAGSVQVRKDAAVVSRVFREMETDTDKLERKVKALVEQQNRGAITAEQYEKALKHLEERYVTGPAKAKAAAEAEKKAADDRRAAMEQQKREAKALAEAEKKALEKRRAAMEQQRKAEQAAAAKEREMNAARQAALPLINRTKTAAEKYAESIRQLNSARRMGAITEKEHQRAIASVRAEMHQAQQAKKLSTRMTQGLSNAFSFLSPQILAASAAMAAFYGATRLLQRSINLAAELEEVNVRFGVLTGSAKDADELVKSMRTLANTTALTFSGLQKNAQTMLAFGVVTERVIPTLKQIGDITSGNDERMQSLSLAFAQMTSAGKLMGQDLLQMVNAGFNPLQEISKQTGVSITELRKQMEAGAISSELVAMAFESATSSGGQFNNMLEASKQTFAGQMRQLNSDIEVLTTAIGEELLPTVKELVSTFSGIGSEENIALIREMTFLATAAGKFGMDPVKSVRSVLERFGIVEKQVEGVAASAAGFGERISEAEDKMSAMLANAKSDAFREMTKEFEDQIALLELGEKGFARREMYAKGFTAEQILQIEAQKEYIEQQQALIDKEKEAERERKKARDEQQRAVEDLMKRGQEMMDNNNPIRAVAKQLADLDVLLNANAIDQATYFKERNKILKEQVAKEGKSQSAAAIEVGSSAAIDFRNQQINAAVDQQYEESKKQTLLQQSQLDALNLANQRLQELGIMRRITP